MSRKFVKLDYDAASSSSDTQDTASVLDWTLCALCQKTTAEKTQCPGSKGGAGYKYVANNLQEFNKLGANPLSVPLATLDEGNGLEATFFCRQAVWHHTCRLKITTLCLNKKRKQTQQQSSCSQLKTRKLSSSPNVKKTCFFCDKEAGKDDLHNVSTFGLDTRIREHTHLLKDHNLLMKLVPGDLIAIEAKYHRKCLAAFYRRKPQCETEIIGDNNVHAFVFAEMVSYIEGFRHSTDSAPVFSMPHLCKLYIDRLRNQGAAECSVHTTRLREKLLQLIPGLTSSKQGKDYVLVFDTDIGKAMKAACINTESDISILSKAAQIIRRDMFQCQGFQDSFSKGCQEDSVPMSLKALMTFILTGPKVIEEPEAETVLQQQAVLSLSQLIVFNGRKSAKPSAFRRHNIEKETPLPVYLSLKVHAETRKKGLIDTLFQMGLGISYQRVLSISAQAAHKVCSKFEQDSVVVPTNMRHNVFTTAVVDNIDHNPGSTTAVDSFHGTSISLAQHPEADEEGEAQSFPRHETPGHLPLHGIPQLPSGYTNVQPIPCTSGDLFVPVSQGPQLPAMIPEEEQHESEWLKHVYLSLETEPSADYENFSWAAYHASTSLPQDKPVTNIGLMPLLSENAHSKALIRHTMGLTKKAVAHLNPSQTPVLAMDQPLYAMAKEIQWRCPENFGEDKYVVMMGGLHIEMAAFKTLGDWMKGSGWTTANTDAGIASPGVADSFLKASHLTRTRHAYQVTAAVLYILLRRAFLAEMASQPNSVLMFDDWQKQKANQPQFKYWLTTLNFILCILQFIRSIRCGNFPLYIQSLKNLIPWIFALDHTNYARWLAVHIRDLSNLEETHPSIFHRFCSGAFVARKTKRRFSALALDHAHEQCNAVIKGDGGAVGLTCNPSALRRWMIAGPEISRMVNEFEGLINGDETIQEKHHEQQTSTQKTFVMQVQSLLYTLEEMGNPFHEDSSYLFALDTKDIMDDDVIQTVTKIQAEGEKQYNTFIQERFINRTKPIQAPIHRNKFPLFSNQTSKRRSVLKRTVTALKNDCSLFSRLYIACQSRQGNLDAFFQHENQAWPPSLSKLGELRTGKKTDLLSCLTVDTQGGDSGRTEGERTDTSVCRPSLMHEPVAELMDDTREDVPLSSEEVGCVLRDTSQDLDDVLHDAVPVPVSYSRPCVSAKVFDGPALVQMLSPKLVNTFEEYFDHNFMPYILKQFDSASRVDIVWDVYKEDSLKAATRERRGCGTRRRVLASAKLPGNWQSFLRVNDNKTELFHFLAEKLVHKATQLEEGQVLVCTRGENTISTMANKDRSHLEPCSHEEADTRMLLHVADCVRDGHDKVLIRTTDTDVLVLAVANVQCTGVQELWLAIGVGKNFKYVAAHQIAAQLGPRASVLPAFHAFSGCDTVSFFVGRGKKRAWNTWAVYQQATEAFLMMMDRPTMLSDSLMDIIERYVVLLYDRISELSAVDPARQALFMKGKKSLENIPPTAAALREHTRRAVYQSGYIWGQCLIKEPILPSPSQWGWKKENTDTWLPLWTILPEAEQSCHELLRCGCKQVCRGRCKCFKANLRCTALCACGGDCRRD